MSSPIVASTAVFPGEKVGVGLILKPCLDTGYIEIVGFRQGSPAERSALSGQIASSGDLLCEVDGRSVHKLHAKDVTELIFGPSSSAVTLTLKHNTPDAIYRRVTLTRAPTVSSATVTANSAAQQQQQHQQQQHQQQLQQQQQEDPVGQAPPVTSVCPRSHPPPPTLPDPLPTVTSARTLQL